MPILQPAHQSRPQPAAAQPGLLSRERILAFVLIALTLAAVYLCLHMVVPFVPALAWALALAILGRPLHRWIAARVKQPDIAAGLAVACVTVFLVVPAVFVIHRVTLEAGQAVASVQEGGQAWKDRLAGQPELLQAVEWVEANLDVKGELPRTVLGMVGDVASILTGSIWAVVQMLLTLLCLFYFFRDHQRALTAVRGLLPLNREETDALFRRVNDTVHATIYGTLLCAAAQGCLGGLMFWMLGLPAPITWGVIMALIAVVPNLGPFVIWGPAALALALQGQYGKAAILATWGLVAVGLIDNLLYPVVVGHRLRMHSLVALFAILGGLYAFGGAGVVLGPVLVGVTIVFINVWRERLAEGKPAEEGINEGGGTAPALAKGRSGEGVVVAAR